MSSIPALTFKRNGWCPDLKMSYTQGIYQPKTREEYLALAPFAVEAQKSSNEPSGERNEAETRDALMAQAIELGLKPHSQIGVKKLKAMIAEHLASLNTNEGGQTPGGEQSEAVS